jgi:hypothetical protein
MQTFESWWRENVGRLKAGTVDYKDSMHEAWRAGQSAGFDRGQDDAYSRVRNRPGDGDMGG